MAGRKKGKTWLVITLKYLGTLPYTTRYFRRWAHSLDAHEFMSFCLERKCSVHSAVITFMQGYGESRLRLPDALD